MNKSEKNGISLAKYLTICMNKFSIFLTAITRFWNNQVLINLTKVFFTLKTDFTISENHKVYFNNHFNSLVEKKLNLNTDSNNTMSFSKNSGKLVIKPHLLAITINWKGDLPKILTLNWEQ